MRCEWQDKTTLASTGHLVHPLLLGGFCAHARLHLEQFNNRSINQHCGHRVGIYRCSHCVERNRPLRGWREGTGFGMERKLLLPLRC